jgi:NO-binding membrane sensor protein with MHYT domain
MWDRELNTLAASMAGTGLGAVHAYVGQIGLLTGLPDFMHYSGMTESESIEAMIDWGERTMTIGLLASFCLPVLAFAFFHQHVGDLKHHD